MVKKNAKTFQEAAAETHPNLILHFPFNQSSDKTFHFFFLINIEESCCEFWWIYDKNVLTVNLYKNNVISITTFHFTK